MREENTDEATDLVAPRSRRARSPVIGILVIMFAGWLLWTLREPTRYFFASRRPLKVGQIEQADAVERLRENQYVRLQGLPERKRATVIEGRWGSYKGLFPLARTRGRVWIAQPRKGRQPPGELTDVFAGRLVSLAKQTFFPKVAEYYAKHMTSTFDIDADELLHAVGHVPAALRDQVGDSLELTADRYVYVGRAFPREYRVQFDLARYPTVEETDRRVSEVGLPFAKLPDSRTFRVYLVVASDQEAPALLARFSDVTQKIGVISRTETYVARFADLSAGSVDAPALRVHKAGGKVPDSYGVAEGKVQVQAVSWPIEIPRGQIISVEVTAPYRIDPQALVLLEGDTPQSYWFFLAMSAVLGIVIASNLVVFWLRIRIRRRT